MANVSFLHSGCPYGCISPNIVIEPGCERFPGRMGTGFFVRRRHRNGKLDTLYYLTARHCLTNDPDANIADVVSRLCIPYFLEGHTETSDDFVPFNEVLTLKHNSPDIPGDLVDLVVLAVGTPHSERKRKHLHSRAAKLPPTGEWLDKFIDHPVSQGAFTAGRGIILSGFGYPYEGTTTDIVYPDNDMAPLEIVTQAAKFTGHLAGGSCPDRLKLNDVSWDRDLNGFSGSPVFVAYHSEHGRQHALAGMMVSGGAGQVQFIKISIIAKAFGLS